MVSQEVTDYVKDTLARGFTPQQVKQALIDAGYSEVEAQQALNDASIPQALPPKPNYEAAAPVATATPAPEEKKSNRKKIILAIILLLILAALAFFLLTNKNAGAPIAIGVTTEKKAYETRKIGGITYGPTEPLLDSTTICGYRPRSLTPQELKANGFNGTAEFAQMNGETKEEYEKGDSCAIPVSEGLLEDKTPICDTTYVDSNAQITAYDGEHLGCRAGYYRIKQNDCAGYTVAMFKRPDPSDAKAFFRNQKAISTDYSPADAEKSEPNIGDAAYEVASKQQASLSFVKGSWITTVYSQLDPECGENNSADDSRNNMEVIAKTIAGLLPSEATETLVSLSGRVYPVSWASEYCGLKINSLTPENINAKGAEGEFSFLKQEADALNIQRERATGDSERKMPNGEYAYDVYYDEEKATIITKNNASRAVTICTLNTKLGAKIRENEIKYEVYVEDYGKELKSLDRSLADITIIHSIDDEKCTTANTREYGDNSYEKDCGTTYHREYYTLGFKKGSKLAIISSGDYSGFAKTEDIAEIKQNVKLIASIIEDNLS